MPMENEQENFDLLDSQVSGDPDDNVDLEALVFGGEEPAKPEAPAAPDPTEPGRTQNDVTADYVERERGEYHRQLQEIQSTVQEMKAQLAQERGRAAALEAALNRPQTLMQPQTPLTQEQLVELFEKNPQAFVAATTRPMLNQELGSIKQIIDDSLTAQNATADVVLRELALSKFETGIADAKAEVDQRCESMGLPPEFAAKAKDTVLDLIAKVGHAYTDMDPSGKVVKNMRFNEIVDRAFGALASDMVTSMRTAGRSRMAGKQANVLSMPVGADRTGYGMNTRGEPSVEEKLLWNLSNRQRRNRTA